MARRSRLELLRAEAELLRAEIDSQLARALMNRAAWPEDAVGRLIDALLHANAASRCVATLSAEEMLRLARHHLGEACNRANRLPGDDGGPGG